jgi:hypothetical protein
LHIVEHEDNNNNKFTSFNFGNLINPMKRKKIQIKYVSEKYPSKLSPILSKILFE